jgi:hypothetical protein
MILIAFTTIGPVFPVLFLRALMSGPKFLSSGKGSVDSPFVKASVKMLAGNPCACELEARKPPAIAQRK